jgi:hypothetical protein
MKGSDVSYVLVVFERFKWGGKTNISLCALEKKSQLRLKEAG